MSNQPNLDPVTLGMYKQGASPFAINLWTALRTNVLVEANSGGGKSWALRCMIERIFGRVPQIIIDPEGEFSTLRAKFDVVLVGKGGDTPADLRSAKLLAIRLLELGTSAVIDLYEMKKTDRPLWVAAFIQALVDAPKHLWRDLLVYVDEAHEFAPQPGHGVTESQSEKACRSALVDLAAKGRKRGFGVVAATQRLGKLSKDFAAELKNVMIGQTFLDIDRERAAESLGIAKANKGTFFQSVKLLQPGTFWVLGRAFGCLEPATVGVGKVQTEHPEAGRRQSAPPPPTAKIKHLLPQLADLPKEAEDELVTVKQLRARVSELEHAVKAAPVVKAVKEDPAALRANTAAIKANTDARDRLVRTLDRYLDVFGGLVPSMKELLLVHEEKLDTLGATLRVAREALDVVPALPTPAHATVFSATATSGKGSLHYQSREVPRPAPTPPDAPTEAVKLNRAAERAILTALKQRGPMDVRRLAVTAGYSPRGGGFTQALQKVRRAGYVVLDGGKLQITEAGDTAIGSVPPLPTGQALVDYWMTQLNRRAEREILRVVVGVYPRTNPATAIAGMTDQGDGTPYEARGGGFTQALQKVRRLGLVEGAAGALVAAEGFFT